MAAILARHRRPHQVIKHDWTEAIDCVGVEAALDADPAIAYVASVHHETTTGRLNDIAALGALCRRRGIGLLLDAVSSFAAEEVRFDEWNLIAAAAGANKCLHGVPGVAFVLARRDALRDCSEHADSLYLDLGLLFREQQAGWSPFTQAVQSFFALHEALCELEESGGQPGRRVRYEQLSALLRRELPAAGAPLLLPEQAYASMLTAFRLPSFLDYAGLHDELKRRGFTIYAGQGHLAPQIFRIATMGAISDPDLERLVDICRTVLSGKAGKS
jgi:2-aminoethylphosphonate-pyruvate transaminase